MSAELRRLENAEHLRRLRAAISRGFRPTTLLLHVQPDSEWDEFDFALFDALDQYERDTNPTTGLPWWLTRTGHPAIAFQIDTVSDDAERALDAYDEAQRDSKAPKRHGEHRYATPVSVDGTPLEGGLAREAFLEYAAKQAESADRDDGLGDLIDRRRPQQGYDATEYGEFRPNAESGT